MVNRNTKVAPPAVPSTCAAGVRLPNAVLAPRLEPSWLRAIRAGGVSIVSAK